MRDEPSTPPAARHPSRTIASLELALVVIPLGALWVSIAALLVRDLGVMGLMLGAYLLAPGLAALTALASLLLPRALGRPIGRQMHSAQFIGLALGLLLAVFLMYAFSQPHSDPPVLREWPVVWYLLLSGSMAVTIHLAASHDRVRPCWHPS